MKRALALVGIAAAVAGYAVGRTRPVSSFVTWNWERTIHGCGHGRDHLAVRNADGVLWMVLHPVMTAQNVKRASGAAAPASRKPAPDVHPKWTAPASDRRWGYRDPISGVEHGPVTRDEALARISEHESEGRRCALLVLSEDRRWLEVSRSGC